jgi:hypothetical protein
MEHCDIRLPDERLIAILARLSFQKLSGGRKPGEENTRHKYRSGKPGDWHKYFNENVTREFDNLVGDLPRALGYN